MTTLPDKTSFSKRPPSFAVEPSQETLKVFRGIKDNMNEFMSYYEIGAKKPASKELLQALQTLKTYADKKPYSEFVFEVGNYGGLELETPGPDDGINSMRDPFVETATERNAKKITFLASVKTVDFVERILYKERFSQFVSKV